MKFHEISLTWNHATCGKDPKPDKKMASFYQYKKTQGDLRSVGGGILQSWPIFIYYLFALD